MDRDYYFVTTFLPPVELRVHPELSSRHLAHFFKENITKKDFEQFAIIRRLTDIENLRLFWQKKAINFGGNLDANQLEERLFLKEKLPRYVLNYLERYTTTKELLAHFPELLNTYFKEESCNNSPFVDAYLRFEWEWRQVVAAIRCKNLGLKLADVFHDADPEDPFIEEILEQKNEAVFEPPARYTALKMFFEQKKHAPFELYQGIEEWRFKCVEEMIEWENFSLPCLLGYAVKLFIVEKWFELDNTKGDKIVEQMLKDIA